MSAAPRRKSRTIRTVYDLDFWHPLSSGTMIRLDRGKFGVNTIEGDVNLSLDELKEYVLLLRRSKKVEFLMLDRYLWRTSRIALEPTT